MNFIRRKRAFRGSQKSRPTNLRIAEETEHKVVGVRKLGLKIILSGLEGQILGNEQVGGARKLIYLFWWSA